MILGAAGAAKCWKLQGWKGSSGPVSNGSLWELLLAELDRPDRTIHWVKVPSHVTIEGNNEADRLAEEGRMSHPRLPALSTPTYHSRQLQTRKVPKRQEIIFHSVFPTTCHCAHPPPPSPPLPLCSAEAQATLSALHLSALPDPESEKEDSGMSATDTESFSEDSTSESGSNCSCSTDCSRG